MKYYCILAIDKASKEVLGYCDGDWSPIQCALYRADNDSHYSGQTASAAWREKKAMFENPRLRTRLTIKHKGHLQEIRKKIFAAPKCGRSPAEYEWNTLKLVVARLAAWFPKLEIGLYRANSKHCPARIDVDSYGRRRSPDYEATRWGLERVRFTMRGSVA